MSRSTSGNDESSNEPAIELSISEAETVKRKRRTALLALILMTVFDLMLASQTPPDSTVFLLVTVIFPATIAFLAAMVLTRPDHEWLDRPEAQLLAPKDETEAEEHDFDIDSASPDELREELELLQSRYDLLTTNIAASVLIYDSNSQLAFCSPYTEVLTGYLLEEILAGPDDFFIRIVVAEHRERFERARKVAELGEDMLVRYQIRHRTGLPMWLETRLVPLNGMHSQDSGIMAVTIDVTDSLNYQRQIEEQNRDLSDFAYMVSHDLKAPIFTIKGMAEALVEDYGETLADDGKELVDYIVSATERLERLVESVIEYSSISTKELKEVDVDLSDVLTSVVADLQEQIRESRAKVEIESALGDVKGSPVRIYQVFSNLIGNAIKYRHPERSPVVKVSAAKLSSGGLRIDVADNGLGIPADKVDDAFRPYKRLHAGAAEGSGIGLACVKKIVERLNGTVSAQSKEGQGSTFSVVFPSPPSGPQEAPRDIARLFQED